MAATAAACESNGEFRMAPRLLTHSGPWCGALTDASVVIRASVLSQVHTASIAISETEDSSASHTTYPAKPFWTDPAKSIRMPTRW